MMLTSAKNPYFEQTIQMLLELHAVMSRGESESDEADAIRDRMDHPWYQLDEREFELASCLSADLYTIDPNETSKHPPSRSGLSDEARSAIVSCLNRDDWEGLLEVIREHAVEIPIDEAAYYRGRCWCELGFDNVGLEFLKFASETEVIFSPAQIVPLWRLGRIEDAFRLCETLYKDSQQLGLYSLMLLANGYALIAESMPSLELTTTCIRRAVELFEESIRIIRTMRNQNREVVDHPWKYTVLATCYDRLGETQKALAACEQALSIDTDNSNALVIHGLLDAKWRERLGSEEKAVKEIERGLRSAVASSVPQTLLPDQLVVPQLPI